MPADGSLGTMVAPRGGAFACWHLPWPSCFHLTISQGERQRRQKRKKWSERQDLNLSPPSDNQVLTTGDTQGDSQTAVTSLHDLSQVVKAWPRLNAALKAAILAIASTATKEGSR